MLPGPQRTGDLPITYYFTYQASDGRLVTHYDAASSASAFALTRQPAGEGVTDTGEILNHATSQNYTVYQAGYFPIVGPLPVSATHAVLRADPAAGSRAGTVMAGAFVLDASGPLRVQLIATGPAIG